MASTLTLDPHTACFFEPGEQTGPVDVYVDIGEHCAPCASWEARWARDVSGRQRLVLRPESPEDSDAPCFVLDRYPCQRFLELEPGDTGPRRVCMDAPSDARFHSFWWGLQRAHLDEVSGWGMLFRAHGEGTLVDLRPERNSQPRSGQERFRREIFYPFVGEWRMEPGGFIGMPDERFHVLAARTVEDASSDLAQTWSYVRLDEEARCRHAFGCSSFGWKRVREVLQWALLWECAPYLLHRDGPEQANIASWFYWLADESALKFGCGELQPVTPYLRAWRDALAGFYGCRLPQISPEEYFYTWGRYHARPDEITAPVPTPGPRRAFKLWMRPTLLSCHAPTPQKVILARQGLQAWARDHLPASEATRLLKAPHK